MGSRAKWLLGALICLVAVLTAATFAQAVDQTSKNGCTSPQPYSGSLTTPPVEVLPAGVGFTPGLRFNGWFEVESVAPGAFDLMTVEYSLDPGVGQPRQWVQFGTLTDQAQPNTGSAPDQPYSNNGTSVAPRFQPFSFAIPPEAQAQIGVEFRITFNTNDATYQGFRGLGIDDVSIDTVGGPLSESFDAAQPPNGWTFDGPSGPGGPFWQVLSNAQNVSVKSPEINPTLVTLADSGALPAAASGTQYAWFGNTDSGTFCGPDFASIDQAPDTIITDGPPDSTAAEDATFSFTSSEPASLFLCTLDGTPSECSSPQTYTGLANGAHTFTVQAFDTTGNSDPTPATRTWTIRPATLNDLPDPQQGVSVNVQEVAGRVLVGIPSGAAARAGARAGQKGINFVPLSEAEQIPVGSFLDTRKGTVRLQSAVNRAGKRQAGKFLDGLFQVRQSRKRRAKGLTNLVLKGASFARCGRRGKKASASLSRRRIRRLRANARGRFRTSGSNSSATVRGTIWDITDRCDGTLTHVKRGRVVVRDFRRKKNITLTSGKSYLAKAPR